MTKGRKFAALQKTLPWAIVLGLLTWSVVFFIAPKPSVRHRVRLAVPGFQSSALVILAHEQGFFADEGIETSMTFRATGRDCLDMVINDKADFAVVFETPVVHASLAGHELSIFTELHRSDHNTAVLGRKDRGITRPADLIGKTVAVVPRTNAEFLLDLLLRSHLIDPARVTVVKSSIAQVLDDLKSGQIDAAAFWEPYLGQALATDKVAYMRFQSSYYSEFSLLASLRGNPDVTDDALYALMRSLVRAQMFFQKEALQAQSIVDRKLHSLGFFVSSDTWKTLDVNLGLSATLLTMLQEEANWYRNRSENSSAVDMRLLLKETYIKAVVPDQVTFQ